MFVSKEIKQKFIYKLMQRVEWTRQVSSTEYVTRCPFCGDSENISHGHFYIHINLEDNSSMVYNCFKCPASGVITKDVSIRLGIEDEDILQDIGVLNKKAYNVNFKKINGEKILFFDYKQPDRIFYPEKLKYVENRLGLKFSVGDLKTIKFIDSIKYFITVNKIKPFISENMINLLENNYVGFLSYGNSHILFRDITNKMKIAWFKFPITQKSRENRIFYTVSSNINPLTKDEINLNLCEGVMDAISIYYNIRGNEENSVVAAVTGKYYEPIIRYFISLGLFGENVNLNIYADNDENFGKKSNYDTRINFYRKILKDIKLLFKSTNVYYNVKEKDCGYPKDKIVLEKFKL